MMRVYDLIDDETRCKLKAIKPAHRPHKKRQAKPLSAADLRELMGTNRQTYRKVNGKVKRK